MSGPSFPFHRTTARHKPQLTINRQFRGGPPNPVHRTTAYRVAIELTTPHERPTRRPLLWGGGTMIRPLGNNRNNNALDR